MAVGDAHVFPGFLTPVLKQLFFPKPPTTCLTCFCRGERQKYTGKKSRLNWGSNSQPPGHESDTLTTKPHRWDPSFSQPFYFLYLSSLPVVHLSDVPKRRLVVTRDSARIQDETTENSAWFFNVLGV